MTTTPDYLQPDWRYANNDWAGANALTYTVYSVAPTPAVYASDGVTLITAGTPGTLMDLTGFTVTGQVYDRRSCSYSYAPTGTIVGDPTMGKISLSLDKSKTNFLRQPFSDWGTQELASLEMMPMVTDLSGNLVTVGIQLLYVF